MMLVTIVLSKLNTSIVENVLLLLVKNFIYHHINHRMTNLMRARFKWDKYQNFQPLIGIWERINYSTRWNECELCTKIFDNNYILFNWTQSPYGFEKSDDIIAILSQKVPKFNVLLPLKSWNPKCTFCGKTFLVEFILFCCWRDLTWDDIWGLNVPNLHFNPRKIAM